MPIAGKYVEYRFCCCSIVFTGLIETFPIATQLPCDIKKRVVEAGHGGREEEEEEEEEEDQDLFIFLRPLSSSPPRRGKSPIAYSCRQCHQKFVTIRELSEHEIEKHDAEINCYHCDKKSSSVDRAITHIRHRHTEKPVFCAYCREPLGKSAELMSDDDWDGFKDHTQKEAVKKRMFRHGSVTNGSISVALRGVGACPHGPPVKCKNFPQCPGAKCLYSHNMCRYEESCNKSTCPFDHPNRPRTCMTCINEMKMRRNFRH
uniref:C2H2-type domain-containing protein n=1 Tax=Caenorhabditis tropicalis TaxID=1561998 RepID=A0A1I7UPS2_9PELO